MIRMLFILFLFAYNTIQVFAQTDSTNHYPIKYRFGISIFTMPGFFAEKNISKKISVEAGLLSLIFLSEACVGMKYQLAGKKKFKFKAGVGCGFTAYFWSAETYPPKSGQDIFLLPLVPLEFSYGRFSLEIQPGYPIKLEGDDEGAIPVIAFLSFYINR
jgi:hypothetical protein